MEPFDLKDKTPIKPLSTITGLTRTGGGKPGAFFILAQDVSKQG
jgi:hypothetical protein